MVSRSRSVQGLTYHGGRLDEAARLYPSAPRPWLDLSTGINPFAWAPAAPLAIDLRALPASADLAALEAAAAAAFDAAHLPIAALPGSEIGLRLIAPADPPRPYHIVGPGYRTHGDALPGATPIGAEGIAAAAAAGGTLLLANPNNPDGATLPPERLLEIARALATQGGLLIVDEAFADARPGDSILPHLSPEDPVLVFRSFGKFFGLAGVRLGFVVGQRARVAALRARLGDWPVSATAIAHGRAAYADTAWSIAMRARLAAAAAALDAVLRAYGLAPAGACPLFRLVESDTAGALFDRLARAGILTRPFDHAPRWLRFGLPGNAAALARLDAALRHG